MLLHTRFIINQESIFVRFMYVAGITDQYKVILYWTYEFSLSTQCLYLSCSWNNSIYLANISSLKTLYINVLNEFVTINGLTIKHCATDEYQTFSQQQVDSGATVRGGVYWLGAGHPRQLPISLRQR